jgi:chromosome segregation ATPase
VKTLKNHNPLQRRPLTPTDYSRLHAEAQSKATWLLRDHVKELDAEMAEERREIELEIERREAEMAELTARVRRLTHRRARAISNIRKQAREVPELQLLANTATGTTVELVEVREAVAALREELAKEVAEASRLRRLVTRAKDRVQRRGAEVGQLSPDVLLGAERLAAAYAEASMLGKGKGRQSGKAFTPDAERLTA